jgi:hypothetical protein
VVVCGKSRANGIELGLPAMALQDAHIAYGRCGRSQHTYAHGRDAGSDAGRSCSPSSGNHFHSGANAFDGGRANRYHAPGPIAPQGSVPSYLNATMKELRGERSVHGLNSSHCLLPPADLGATCDYDVPRPPWAIPGRPDAGCPNDLSRHVDRPLNRRFGAENRHPNVPPAALQHTAASSAGLGAMPMEQKPSKSPWSNQGGYGVWPPPPGPLPPGHSGFNANAPPPMDSRALLERSLGPGSMVRPHEGASVQRPSCQQAAAEPAVAPRQMTNGFKDSTDFIDAGADSEAEFLSTRSRPPARKKGKGGRSRRIRDEVSCMPCLIMC